MTTVVVFPGPRLVTLSLKKILHEFTIGLKSWEFSGHIPLLQNPSKLSAHHFWYCLAVWIGAALCITVPSDMFLSDGVWSRAYDVSPVNSFQTGLCKDVCLDIVVGERQHQLMGNNVQLWESLVRQHHQMIILTGCVTVITMITSELLWV